MLVVACHTALIWIVFGDLGANRNVKTHDDSRERTSANAYPSPSAEAVWIRSRAVDELGESIKDGNASSPWLRALKDFVLVMACNNSLGGFWQEKAVKMETSVLLQGEIPLDLNFVAHDTVRIKLSCQGVDTMYLVSLFPRGKTVPVLKQKATNIIFLDGRY